MMRNLLCMHFPVLCCVMLIKCLSSSLMIMSNDAQDISHTKLFVQHNFLHVLLMNY